MSRFDLVVFGATGFTGQYVVEEVIRVTDDNPSLTWAVAGRRASRLKEVVADAFKNQGKEPKEIAVITADVSDAKSLIEMCKQANVVVNCVGPYRFYGEAVVKACIENGAHHVDISGEPQFLERMQLEQHENAKTAGVYVVGACGYDSIPCEAGVEHLRSKFPGQLSYVEAYMSTHFGPEGMHYNYGTWQSAIYGFAHAKELPPLRRQLFPQRLPKTKYRAPNRNVLFYSDDVDSWCLPFPGSDKSVVTRTQHYLYDTHKLRPFDMKAYIKQSSIWTALGTMLVAVIFGIFASFSFGRKLLEKHPKFFSFGMFSKQGATRSQIKQTTFTTTVIGYGHKEVLTEPTDQHDTPPDTKLVVKVKGPEPGYISTPICMIQAALLLIQEVHKLPPGGGVYTAGAAFYNTSWLERLVNNGLNIVSGDASVKFK